MEPSGPPRHYWIYESHVKAEPQGGGVREKMSEAELKAAMQDVVVWR